MGDLKSQTILSMRTVGGLGLQFGKHTIALSARKSRAILGYLALTETGEETRERLVGLLWSESPEEKARASLRQCLRELRDILHAAGFDGLHTDKRSVSLRKEAVRVDVGDILDHVNRRSVHPRLLDTTGLTDQILPEVETVDPVFRTWLLAKRQSLHNMMTRQLEAALRELPSSGAAGEDLAVAILNLDATHEEACRHLMSMRAARGDISGALKVYNSLWELLERDYDVEPSGETQQLVAQIKMAEPVRENRTPIPAVSPKPVRIDVAAPIAQDAGRSAIQSIKVADTKLVVSIAPFDMARVEPGRHYVVQGFRRELIGCLIRFREWLVREQSPSTTGANSLPDEYVLEAGAMEAGPAVRLVLTLREAANNAYLWSDHLHLTFANWSEAQQMIVRRIAIALNVHVSVGRMALVAAKASPDALAYDLWLRGQAHFLTYEPDGWKKASELYGGLVAKYPEFGPAYSSMAQLKNTVHFVHPGLFRNAATTQQALDYAGEATRIDPMDSRAQLCLGWANAMSGRFEQASIHHRLACDLNENDPWTLVSSALGFAFRGECGQARLLADRALELCPTPSGTHWRYQAMIRYMCNDLAGCVSAAEQAEASIQNVYFWKAAALSALGRKEEAKQAADTFFEAVQKRWFSPEPPSPGLVARWILHGFPIARVEDFERLRDDFGTAGAPVARIKHAKW